MFERRSSAERVIRETQVIHSTAIMGTGVRLGRDVRIGAGAVIDGNVEVLDGAVIQEHVVIRGTVRLGRRCLVGPFGYIEGQLAVGDGTVLDSHFRLCDTSHHRPTRIGSECVVRSGVVIYEGVEIGDSVTIGHHTIIRPRSIIANRVSIGSLNQIEGDCEIGEATRFHSDVHVSNFSKIGAHCFIGPGFVSTNTPYPLSDAETQTIKGVTIEDHAKIGANVTAAPGVTIGRNSLVGVGAVVTSDVPPNSFTFGATRLTGMPVDQLKVPGSLEKPYRLLE